MKQPKIYYGNLEQPLHRNAQYLLMEAGITDGQYPTKEFLEKVDAVSLERVRKDECRRDVENQRVFLRTFAKGNSTITIKDFHPDREDLENFVDTTFAEMHRRLTYKTMN